MAAQYLCTVRAHVFLLQKQFLMQILKINSGNPVVTRTKIINKLHNKCVYPACFFFNKDSIPKNKWVFFFSSLTHSLRGRKDAIKKSLPTLLQICSVSCHIESVMTKRCFSSSARCTGNTIEFLYFFFTNLCLDLFLVNFPSKFISGTWWNGGKEAKLRFALNAPV